MVELSPFESELLEALRDLVRALDDADEVDDVEREAHNARNVIAAVDRRRRRNDPR